MSVVPVTTQDGSYPVHVVSGVLDRAGELVAPLVRGRTAFVVTDEHVAPLYLDRVVHSLEASGFTVAHHAVAPGETSKCGTVLFDLYDRFLDAGLTRSDVVVALGGGVPGDLGGFAAATWLRGVPVVQIPTSVLAQIDSSVGGKTGIDLPGGKNLVGAFHQPLLVLADPDTLKTLPARVRADGLAEALKHGALFDPELFSWCAAGARDLEDGHDTAWAVERNVRLKAGVVERDTRESNERMLLNFGHTVGHAVEKLTEYKTYTHGEAVGIGMMAAIRIGIRLGITPDDLLEPLAQALLAIGLPTHADGLNADDVAATVLSDKKNRSGRLHLILLESIGQARIHPMDAPDAQTLIREVWRDD